MDSKRKRVLAVAIVSACLILAGILPSQWFAGSHGSSSYRIGLLHGEECRDAVCRPLPLDRSPDAGAWPMLGTAAFIAGLLALVTALVLAGMLAADKHARVPTVPLVVPVGLAVGCALAFMGIAPRGAALSWAVFVALAGYLALSVALTMTRKLTRP